MPEETKLSPELGKQSLPNRLNRLAMLSGTDEGFFVLALHSFVERYAHEADPLLRCEEHFDELVWKLGEIVKNRRNLPHESIKPLVRIIKEHKLTHRVRHNFEKLDREEAMAVVHNFLGFCAACGIGDPALDRFRESLKLWDEKTPPLERGEQLREKGMVTANGREYVVLREGVLRASYLLRAADGAIRARAERKGWAGSAYLLLLDASQILLRKKILTMRETFLILDPSGQAGSIIRESLFSRRLAVELKEKAAGMPREILFFLVWLALMIYRKDSADSAAA